MNKARVFPSTISKARVITILIFTIVAVLYLAARSNYLYGDEDYYFVAARSIHEGKPFHQVSELRERPITTAPLLPLLLSPVAGNLGIHAIGSLRIVTVLLSIGGLIFAYLWIRLVFQPELWNLVLAVATFNHIVFYFSHWLTTYALLFLLTNVILWMLALYERGRTKLLLPLALLLGLGTLANYGAAGLCLGVMVYLLVRKKFKPVLYCGLAYIFVVSGWVMYVYFLMKSNPGTDFAYGHLFSYSLVVDRGLPWYAWSAIARFSWTLGIYAFRVIPWLLLGFFFSGVYVFPLIASNVLKMLVGVVPSLLLACGVSGCAWRAWHKQVKLPEFLWPFLGYLAFVIAPGSAVGPQYLMPVLLPILYFVVQGAEQVWQFGRRRSVLKLNVARLVLVIMLVAGIGNCLLVVRLVYLETQYANGERVEPATGVPDQLLDELLGMLELPRPLDWLHWLEQNSHPDDRAISVKFSRYTYVYLNQPGLDLVGYGLEYDVADIEEILSNYPQINHMIVDTRKEAFHVPNRVLETLAAQQPERFPLLYYSPYSEIAIYAVEPPSHSAR